MKKRVVCVLLAMLLVLGYANATVWAAEPHYYATALQEFIKDATGKTTAVLFDLDGDGNDEMIAFDEGTAKNEAPITYAENGKITIFDIADGKPISSTIGLNYLITCYHTYITKKNYVVVSDYWEGTLHQIYKYENGVLTEESQLSDGEGFGFDGSNRHSINGVACNESQYNDKLDELGIEVNMPDIVNYDSVFTIGFRRGVNDIAPIIKDDTAKILDMTAKPVAVPSVLTVLFNGRYTAFAVYNINGNNYFKLRDMAYGLDGSEKQFEVDWDTENNAISLTSGKAYTKVEGEAVYAGVWKGGKGSANKTPVPTNSKIYLDGKEITLTAYNIDGNNYFKLRDIGQAFDFGVDWDGAKNTIAIDTSRGYASN